MAHRVAVIAASAAVLLVLLAHAAAATTTCGQPRKPTFFGCWRVDSSTCGDTCPTTDSGGTCKLECAKGYTPSTAVMTCMNTGLWNPGANCDYLRIPDDEVSPTELRRLGIRLSIKYQDCCTNDNDQFKVATTLRDELLYAIGYSSDDVQKLGSMFASYGISKSPAASDNIIVDFELRPLSQQVLTSMSRPMSPTGLAKRVTMLISKYPDQLDTASAQYMNHAQGVDTNYPLQLCVDNVASVSCYNPQDMFFVYPLWAVVSAPLVLGAFVSVMFCRKATHTASVAADNEKPQRLPDMAIEGTDLWAVFGAVLEPGAFASSISVLWLLALTRDYVGLTVFGGLSLFLSFFLNLFLFFVLIIVRARCCLWAAVNVDGSARAWAMKHPIMVAIVGCMSGFGFGYVGILRSNMLGWDCFNAAFNRSDTRGRRFANYVAMRDVWAVIVQDLPQVFVQFYALGVLQSTAAVGVALFLNLATLWWRILRALLVPASSHNAAISPDAGQDPINQFSVPEAVAVVPSGRIAREELMLYEVIGEGTSAVVYRAVYHDQLVAVKAFHEHLFATDETIQEAILHSQLVHPNVVRFVGMCVFDRHAWMVLEYLPYSLERVLDSRRLTLEQTLDLASGLAMGLAYLHSRGVAHKDLQPENILLDTAGEPKIADFGFLPATDERILTRARIAKGNPYYMAPEQLAGSVGTALSDWYTFGTILWEMITGMHPLSYLGEHAVGPAVLAGTRPMTADWMPPSLIQLMKECWEADATRRPGFDRIMALLHAVDLQALLESELWALPPREQVVPPEPVPSSNPFAELGNRIGRSLRKPYNANRVTRLGVDDTGGAQPPMSPEPMSARPASANTAAATHVAESIIDAAGALAVASIVAGQQADESKFTAPGTSEEPAADGLAEAAAAAALAGITPGQPSADVTATAGGRPKLPPLELPPVAATDVDEDVDAMKNHLIAAREEMERRRRDLEAKLTDADKRQLMAEEKERIVHEYQAGVSQLRANLSAERLRQQQRMAERLAARQAHAGGDVAAAEKDRIMKEYQASTVKLQAELQEERERQRARLQERLAKRMEQQLAEDTSS